ncbi:MAG: FecR domain-containing protein [Myxococcales bacterium]|nr:FecR domain-containing protein [Myxococcales bacterium]
MAELPEAERRAQFIEVPLDEARIERQWGRIEASGLPTGEAGRSRRLWFPLGAAALAAVALAAGVALLRPAAPVVPQVAAPQVAPPPAVMQAEVEPVVMGLSDGSEVELLSRTRVAIEHERRDAVELRLERGVARFAVSKRPQRRFTVHAGDLSVTVVGTRFELKRQAQLVDLHVTEGVVEVRAPGAAVRRVTAGERFGWDGAARVQAQALPEAPLDPPPEALPGDAPEPHATSGRRAKAPAMPSARQLFEQAHLARRAGRLKEAAEAYGLLVSRYPGDVRAGLSAFEVGRIRMDALGDARGAIAAFQKALSLEGKGSYREDALARIALAYDALGDGVACRRARERYLSSYAAGVHRAALSTSCGDADL